MVYEFNWGRFAIELCCVGETPLSVNNELKGFSYVEFRLKPSEM